MRDEDFVKTLFVASTHDNLLFFTNHGRAYKMKAFEIPEAGRTARGLALVNLLNLNSGEKISAAMPITVFEEDSFLLLLTRKGIMKKTAVSQFESVKKSGLLALSIREDDELINVMHTDGNNEIFIASNKGMGIRFFETQIRPMGRTAMGVKAMNLTEDDYVVSAGVISQNTDEKLLFVSENGYGKCTEFDEFRLQRRSGKGLRVYKITPKTGNLVGVCTVGEREELMLINSEGVIIRMKISGISIQGRVTQGVKLINLENGVTVVDMAKISEEQSEDGQGNLDNQPE